MEFKFNDERLEYLATLMIEIMSVQVMMQDAKRNGLFFDDMDKQLTFFDAAKREVLQKINDRINELHDKEIS